MPLLPRRPTDDPESRGAFRQDSQQGGIGGIHWPEIYHDFSMTEGIGQFRR
jgi:hypothetical protein